MMHSKVNLILLKNSQENGTETWLLAKKNYVEETRVSWAIFQ